MKKIICSLPCAYLLFRFYFLAFNVTIQKFIVICCVATYVLLNFKKVFDVSDRKHFSSNVIFISLFVALITIVPIISGTADFSFARTMLTMYLNLLCWTAFVVHIKKVSKNSNDGDAVYTLTDEYGMVISLYVAFSVCCILLPRLKVLWMSLVDFSEYEQNLLGNISAYAGRIGWDGFAGYTATFMCSLSVLLCCVCLFTDRSQKVVQNRKDYPIYIYLIISFVGNFLYGRVGTIVSLIVLGLFIVMNMLKANRWKKLLVILSIGCGLILLVNILKDRVEVFSNIYSWAFEPFLNYLSGRGFSSTSSDHLYTMYFMPSFKTLLLGDGYYTAPGGSGYYMATDVGILRLILYWGIVPTLMLYLCLFGLFRRSLLGNKLMCILLVFALFEFKGEICWYMIPIFLAIGLLGENQKYKQRFVLRI